jgi:hypothetical protein
MARRARILTWNGKDVPAELRDLPAGRYVVEAVDEEAPALSPEEEAGIEAAVESYRQGRVVDAKRAREIIDADLAVTGRSSARGRAPSSVFVREDSTRRHQARPRRAGRELFA